MANANRPSVQTSAEPLSRCVQHRRHVNCQSEPRLTRADLAPAQHTLMAQRARSSARGWRESLPDQTQARFAGLTVASELARGTRALDQAAPPLVPAVLESDLAPARQRAVIGPVGQRPLPRLPPQISARTTAAARHLTVRARLRRTVPRTLHVPVATFLTGDLRPPQGSVALVDRGWLETGRVTAPGMASVVAGFRFPPEGDLGRGPLVPALWAVLPGW
jgi:hypothetical protein